MKNTGLAWAFGLPIGSASAALHERAGGMIYDDVLDITRLANASQGAGSSFAADAVGSMTWNNALAWAASLEHGGFTDWRLPSAFN